MIRIDLPAVLDRTAAATLAPQLLAELSSGDGLVLGGEQVVQIGQAGLQLLLAAARTAGARGAELAIEAPSDALVAAAELAGLADLLPPTTACC